MLKWALRKPTSSSPSCPCNPSHNSHIWGPTSRRTCFGCDHLSSWPYLLLHAWTHKPYSTIPHSAYPVGPGWWKRKSSSPLQWPIPSLFSQVTLSRTFPITRGIPCALGPPLAPTLLSGGEYWNMYLAEGNRLVQGLLPGLGRHSWCKPLSSLWCSFSFAGYVLVAPWLKAPLLGRWLLPRSTFLPRSAWNGVSHHSPCGGNCVSAASNGRPHLSLTSLTEAPHEVKELKDPPHWGGKFWTLATPRDTRVETMVEKTGNPLRPGSFYIISIFPFSPAIGFPPKVEFLILI